MDELSFNDKRHLKLLIDLEKWNLEKNKIQKLFTHPKSKYSFISNSNSYGVFTILDNESSTGSIKIIDFVFFFNFMIEVQQLVKNISNKNTINPDYEYNIDLDGISVKFLKNSFVSIKIFNDITNMPIEAGKACLNKSFEIGSVPRIDELFLFI